MVQDASALFPPWHRSCDCGHPYELVVLELHILSNRRHFKACLLDILFGHESDFEEDGGLIDEGALRPFRDLGQSHMRAKDSLQSLMFDWSDTLTVTSTELQFLGQLNLLTCIRKD